MTCPPQCTPTNSRPFQHTVDEFDTHSCVRCSREGRKCDGSVPCFNCLQLGLSGSCYKLASPALVNVPLVAPLAVAPQYIVIQPLGNASSQFVTLRLSASYDSIELLQPMPGPPPAPAEAHKGHKYSATCNKRKRAMGQDRSARASKRQRTTQPEAVYDKEESKAEVDMHMTTSSSEAKLSAMGTKVAQLHELPWTEGEWHDWALLRRSSGVYDMASFEPDAAFNSSSPRLSFQGFGGFLRPSLDFSLRDTGSHVATMCAHDRTARFSHDFRRMSCSDSSVPLFADLDL